MLDAHPDLAIPPETHFILQFAQVGEQTSILHHEFLETIISHRTWGDYRISEDRLKERVFAIESFDIGEALRVFYSLYAERFGKVRWGDKTPLYVRRIMYIQKLLPEAHFLHVVRDGRDVALSNKKLWFGPNSIEEAAERWQLWINHARKQARYLEWYKEIRYEDLVTDTEPVLKDICQFLELPWNPLMLDYHLTAEKRMDEINRNAQSPSGEGTMRGADRIAIHSLTNKPPQRGRIGRWKNEMSEPDRKRFEELAGELLDEFGYEVG